MSAFESNNSTISQEEVDIVKSVFNEQHDKFLGLPVFTLIKVPTSSSASFPLDFFSVGETSDGPLAHVMYTEKSPIKVPQDSDSVHGVMINFSDHATWSLKDVSDGKTDFNSESSKFLESINEKICNSQLRLLLESGSSHSNKNLEELIESIETKSNKFTHILVDSEIDLDNDFLVEQIKNIIQITDKNETFQLVQNKKLESKNRIVFIQKVKNLKNISKQCTDCGEGEPFILLTDNSRASLISIVNENGLQVFPDPVVGRNFMAGIFGHVPVSLMSLDNRVVIAGHINEK